MRACIHVAAFVVLFAASSDAAEAQEFRTGLLGGVSFPQAPMAERRARGWEVGGSVIRDGVPWAFRADLAYSHYPGIAAERAPGGRYADLSNVALRASVLLIGPAKALRHYLLVGAGIQFLHDPQAWSDRERAAGLHIGAGWRLELGPGAVFAEVRGHVVLSSYGNGPWEWSRYVPLSMGVLF